MRKASSRSSVPEEDPEPTLSLAVAAAPDQSTADSLLALHARLLQQTSGCGQAMFQYRALLRRSGSREGAA